MTNRMSFRAAQRAAQTDFFRRSLPPEAIQETDAVQLHLEHPELNLAPPIRTIAPRYFAKHRISWHKFAHHGCSSQVCCLNFLMPLAMRPLQVAPIIARALGVPSVELMPVEKGPDGQPWYIGFEWIGRENYLGEWGATLAPPRGANVTSADAIVRVRIQDRIEIVLIEWKYIENYGSKITSGSMETRHVRYDARMFDPAGPLKSNLSLTLDDFMWEPFYQLLRQQMLAWQMEKSGESEAQRVSVMHISPSGNTQLHRVTAPALKDLGDDAFTSFQSLLQQPDRFQARSIEEVFGPFLESAMQGDDHEREWADYLVGRYGFLPDRVQSA